MHKKTSVTIAHVIHNVNQLFETDKFDIFVLILVLQLLSWLSLTLGLFLITHREPRERRLM